MDVLRARNLGRQRISSPACPVARDDHQVHRVFAMISFVGFMAVRTRSVIDDATRFEMGTQQSMPNGAVYSTKKSVARTSLRYSTLSAMQAGADNDQTLARAILGAVQSTTSD